MNFGFSYIGLIYLIMLFAPNLIWAKNRPEGYAEQAEKENKLLLFFERTGEIAVCCIVLVFSDFNINAVSYRSLWLLVSFIIMMFYEWWWIRYFKSGKTLKDFYGRFFGIPAAGAVLPVCAFLFLAVYGKNLFLLFADVILAIGHIGIHIGHFKSISEV